MNEKFVLILFLIRASACLRDEVLPLEIKDTGEEMPFIQNIVDEEKSTENSLDNSSRRFSERRVEANVYKTVKKYYCNADTNSFLYGNEEPFQLIFGKGGWSFPRQDVNLTLYYPLDDDENKLKYMITGFEVILYMDGAESKGYITHGGVLQERISLTFVVGNVSTLGYQFTVLGSFHRGNEYGVGNTGRHVCS